MAFDLHHGFATLMDEAGWVLCGYNLAGERESRTHIQVDYLGIANLNEPRAVAEFGPLPFEVTTYNVFELEGPSRTVDFHRIRYLLGRTLVLENPPHRLHRYGEIGLTVICVRKPVKLLGEDYIEFKRVNQWKYRTCLLGIPVTLVILRELHKVDCGLAGSLLQLLEPDQQRRRGVWKALLGREIAGREFLKQTMMRLDGEVYMTVYEEIKAEGFQQGIECERRTLVGNMLKRGLAIDQIAQMTGLTALDLKKIEKSMA